MKATLCDICGLVAPLPFMQLRFQMQLKSGGGCVIDYPQARDVCRSCATKPLTIAQLQGVDPFVDADAEYADHGTK